MEKKTLTKQEKKAELIRTVKFVGFSISAGVIQILSYTLLYELAHFPEWLSYLIALILSVIWNFTLNREFTFKSANNVPIAMLKVAAYYAVFTPLSTLLEKWLTESLGWNGYLVTFLNMFINFVTEYLFDRFVVFGKSIDTNKRAKKGETDAADAASEEIAEEILEKTEEETTE
jgi:putative flippase GtrA